MNTPKIIGPGIPMPTEGQKNQSAIELETISIPKAELQEWLQHLQTGLKPSVIYSSDAVSMLQEAYDLRGSLLQYLGGSLGKYVKN